MINTHDPQSMCSIEPRKKNVLAIGDHQKLTALASTTKTFLRPRLEETFAENMKKRACSGDWSQVSWKT